MSSHGAVQRTQVASKPLQIDRSYKREKILGVVLTSILVCGTAFHANVSTIEFKSQKPAAAAYAAAKAAGGSDAATLSEQIVAGATTLKLIPPPQGIKAGDEIIFAKGTSSEETNTVKSVVANRRRLQETKTVTVTLVDPVKFKHSAASKVVIKPGSEPVSGATTFECGCGAAGSKDVCTVPVTDICGGTITCDVCAPTGGMPDACEDYCYVCTQCAGTDCNICIAACATVDQTVVCPVVPDITVAPYDVTNLLPGVGGCPLGKYPSKRVFANVPSKPAFNTPDSRSYWICDWIPTLKTS